MNKTFAQFHDVAAYNAALINSNGDITRDTIAFIDDGTIRTREKVYGIKVNREDNPPRTYPVKIDSSYYGYVEVPWTDTVTPAYNDTEVREQIAGLAASIDALGGDHFLEQVQEALDLLNQARGDIQTLEDLLASAQESGPFNEAEASQIREIVNYFSREDKTITEYLRDVDTHTNETLNEHETELAHIREALNVTTQNPDGSYQWNSYEDLVQAIRNEMGQVYMTKSEGISRAEINGLDSKVTTVQTEMNNLAATLEDKVTITQLHDENFVKATYVGTLYDANNQRINTMNQTVENLGTQTAVNQTAIDLQKNGWAILAQKYNLNTTDYEQIAARMRDDLTNTGNLSALDKRTLASIQGTLGDTQSSILAYVQQAAAEKDQQAKNAWLELLATSNASTVTIHADNIDLQGLVPKLQAKNVFADYGEFDTIRTKTLSYETLKADNAEFQEVKAKVADIESLYAKKADITSLVAGSLTTDLILGKLTNEGTTNLKIDADNIDIDGLVSRLEANEIIAKKGDFDSLKTYLLEARDVENPDTGEIENKIVVKANLLDIKGIAQMVEARFMDPDTLTVDAVIGIITDKNNYGSGMYISAENINLDSNTVIRAINAGVEEGETQLTIDANKLNLNSGTVIKAINGGENGSSLKIDADKLNVTGIVEAAGLDAKYLSTSNIIAKINESAETDEDHNPLMIDASKINLNSGAIIEAINREGDESNLTISADKIDLDGYVTANELATEKATITELIGTKASLDEITTRYILGKLDDENPTEETFLKIKADHINIDGLVDKLVANEIFADKIGSETERVTNAYFGNVSFDDAIGNKVNTLYILGQLDPESEDQTHTVLNISADYINIDGLVDKILATQVTADKVDSKIINVTDSLYAKKATFDDLSATVSNFGTIYAKTADIDEIVTDKIDAKIGNFDELYADKATVNELSATVGNFDSIYAKSADITELVATQVNANIANLGELYATKADISGLLTVNELDVKTLKIGGKLWDYYMPKDGKNGQDGQNGTVTIDMDTLIANIIKATYIDASRIKGNYLYIGWDYAGVHYPHASMLSYTGMSFKENYDANTTSDWSNHNAQISEETPHYFWNKFAIYPLATDGHSYNVTKNNYVSAFAATGNLNVVKNGYYTTASGGSISLGKINEGQSTTTTPVLSTSNPYVLINANNGVAEIVLKDNIGTKIINTSGTITDGGMEFVSLEDNTLKFKVNGDLKEFSGGSATLTDRDMDNIVSRVTNAVNSNISTTVNNNLDPKVFNPSAGYIAVEINSNKTAQLEAVTNVRMQQTGDVKIATVLGKDLYAPTSGGGSTTVRDSISTYKSETETAASPKAVYDYAQPRGSYLTSSSLSEYALSSEIPTTYIKDITKSGNTFTVTHADGTMSYMTDNVSSGGGGISESDAENIAQGVVESALNGYATSYDLNNPEVNVSYSSGTLTVYVNNSSDYVTIPSSGNITEDNVRGWGFAYSSEIPTNYLTQQSLNDYYTKSEVDSKISSSGGNSSVSWSDIDNKPTWIGSSKPSYTASEVGALSSSDASMFVQNASSNYIKSVSVSDNTLTFTKGNDGTVTYTPTVTSSSVSWGDVSGKPSWIGSSKPTYTATEVGAIPNNSELEDIIRDFGFAYQSEISDPSSLVFGNGKDTVRIGMTGISASTNGNDNTIYVGNNGVDDVQVQGSAITISSTEDGSNSRIVVGDSGIGITGATIRADQNASTYDITFGNKSKYAIEITDSGIFLYISGEKYELDPSAGDGPLFISSVN